MNPTVDSLLEEAAGILVGCDEARREAQVLLGHVLGASRAWLSGHGEDKAEQSAAAEFRDLVERRRFGEPIAYLVGEREFYGLGFRVMPDVLIPRADTETTMVERVLIRRNCVPNGILYWIKEIHNHWPTNCANASRVPATQGLRFPALAASCPLRTGKLFSGTFRARFSRR